MDGGDGFRFDLGYRDRIKYFVFSIYDQDGNTIEDMTDYFMHIQFIIWKKDETKSLCIGISGDISFRYNNMESNKNNGVYKPSD